MMVCYKLINFRWSMFFHSWRFLKELSLIFFRKRSTGYPQKKTMMVCYQLINFSSRNYQTLQSIHIPVLRFMTSPPRSSSLIDVLPIIPWYLTCLKTNSNTWFLSMLCNPFCNSHFFVILTWMILPAFSKWIHPRTGYLCKCSWHVCWITQYWCTTGR